MAQKHYTIDNEKQNVYVVMELVNDKELKLVKKYIKLGYTLIPVEKEKRIYKTKEQKQAEEKEKAELAAKKPFSEVNVQTYLEENGTAAQKKKYYEMYNEQAHDKNGNPVYYKTDSPDGKFKKGEPKKKGHIATLSWFKEEFPKYKEEFEAK